VGIVEPEPTRLRSEDLVDEQQTRTCIDQHADAVVRGDMDAVAADFTESLQPHLPEIAKALPTPVTDASVLSVDVGDTESVAMIRYSGASGDVTIRSRWQDEGGRPVIVHAEPAG
jgi:hypothetical protein